MLSKLFEETMKKMNLGNVYYNELCVNQIVGKTFVQWY